MRYEIVVRGTTGPVVETALEGFERTACADGRTHLVGDVADASALNSLLLRLNDLRVDVTTVRQLDDRDHNGKETNV